MHTVVHTSTVVHTELAITYLVLVDPLYAEHDRLRQARAVSSSERLLCLQSCRVPYRKENRTHHSSQANQGKERGLGVYTIDTEYSGSTCTAQEPARLEYHIMCMIMV